MSDRVLLILAPMPPNIDLVDMRFRLVFDSMDEVCAHLSRVARRQFTFSQFLSSIIILIIIIIISIINIIIIILEGAQGEGSRQ